MTLFLNRQDFANARNVPSPPKGRVNHAAIERVRKMMIHFVLFGCAFLNIAHWEPLRFNELLILHEPTPSKELQLKDYSKEEDASDERKPAAVDRFSFLFLFCAKLHWVLTCFPFNLSQERINSNEDTTDWEDKFDEEKLQMYDTLFSFLLVTIFLLKFSIHFLQELTNTDKVNKEVKNIMLQEVSCFCLCVFTYLFLQMMAYSFLFGIGFIF
jgi:hypothetical protein